MRLTIERVLLLKSMEVFSETPEEDLLELIFKGMSTNGWRVRNVTKVVLDKGQIVYAGELYSGDSSKSLFAKVVSRETICDTCEDVYYIFVFEKALN